MQQQLALLTSAPAPPPRWRSRRSRRSRWRRPPRPVARRRPRPPRPPRSRHGRPPSEPAPLTSTTSRRPSAPSPASTRRPRSRPSARRRAWPPSCAATSSAPRASKAFTAKHRAQMADPRVVNGFRPATKEITYQIVVERSKGSRVWDLDGNEYVDVLNGFGMNLFGWQPDFVNDAVRAQLDRGYEIGPMHPLAAEVSELVCELTGIDRAGLCNTGSEAVMAAMRIARTVTGRSTVVMFTGAYHGTFDEVLVRAGRNAKGMSAAPGMLQGMFGEIRVLDYGTPESLRIHPRQCRRPGRRAGRAGAEPPARLPAARNSCASCARSPRSPAPPDLRRGRHRLPLRPRRRPGALRHPRRPGHLRQGHRRRLAGRRRGRQARLHGRARRRRLAVRRRLDADRRRDLLRRHLRAPSAGAGRGQGLAAAPQAGQRRAAADPEPAHRGDGRRTHRPSAARSARRSRSATSRRSGA